MTRSEAARSFGQQGELDPHLTALLGMLLAEQMAGKRRCSLPKLCKRLDMRMSTLQRYLAQLDGADIVLVEPNASGAPTVGLTDAGCALAEAIVLTSSP